MQLDQKTVAIIRDAIIKSVDERHHHEWFKARSHFIAVIDDLSGDIGRDPQWLAVVDGRGRHIDFINPNDQGAIAAMFGEEHG
jgi:hypothetical protein